MSKRIIGGITFLICFVFVAVAVTAVATASGSNEKKADGSCTPTGSRAVKTIKLPAGFWTGDTRVALVQPGATRTVVLEGYVATTSTDFDRGTSEFGVESPSINISGSSKLDGQGSGDGTATSDMLDDGEQTLVNWDTSFSNPKGSGLYVYPTYNDTVDPPAGVHGVVALTVAYTSQTGCAAGAT